MANDLVVFELFSDTEAEEISVTGGALYDLTSSFSALAEGAAAEFGSVGRITLRLIGARQGSLLLEFRAVVDWIAASHEAIADWSTALGVAVAVLEYRRIARRKNHEDRDPNYEAVVNTLRSTTLSEQLVGNAERVQVALTHTGCTSMEIRVPGAPTVIIEALTAQEAKEAAPAIAAQWPTLMYHGLPKAEKQSLRETIAIIEGIESAEYFVDEDANVESDNLIVEFDPKISHEDRKGLERIITHLIDVTRRASGSGTRRGNRRKKTKQ